MSFEIPSRSDRISERSLVPSTFLRVVAARSLVEWLYVVFVKKINLEALVTWSHLHCRVPGLRRTHWSWPQRPQWRWQSLETESGHIYYDLCGFLSFGLTSCGGTSKDTVLMSTGEKLSIQGITKKRPGPWEEKNVIPISRFLLHTVILPFFRRPSLNITALSYSWTTWTKTFLDKV